MEKEEHYKILQALYIELMVILNKYPLETKDVVKAFGLIIQMVGKHQALTEEDKWLADIYTNQIRPKTLRDLLSQLIINHFFQLNPEQQIKIALDLFKSFLSYEDDKEKEALLGLAVSKLTPEKTIDSVNLYAWLLQQPSIEIKNISFSQLSHYVEKYFFPCAETFVTLDDNNGINNLYKMQERIISAYQEKLIEMLITSSQHSAYFNKREERIPVSFDKVMNEAIYTIRSFIHHAQHKRAQNIFLHLNTLLNEESSYINSWKTRNHNLLEQLYQELKNEKVAHFAPKTNQTWMNQLKIFLQQRERLEQLREKLKINLNENTHSYASLISCLQNYRQQLIVLLNEIFQSIAELIEPLIGPAPCAWSFILAGSYARAEMGPYSDIDGAILIEEETYRTHPYFSTFFKTLQKRFLLFGEPWIYQNGCIQMIGLHLDEGDMKYLHLLTHTPEGLSTWVSHILKSQKINLDNNSTSQTISILSSGTKEEVKPTFEEQTILAFGLLQVEQVYCSHQTFDGTLRYQKTLNTQLQKCWNVVQNYAHKELLRISAINSNSLVQLKQYNLLMLYTIWCNPKSYPSNDYVAQLTSLSNLLQEDFVKNIKELWYQILTERINQQFSSKCATVRNHLPGSEEEKYRLSNLISMTQSTWIKPLQAQGIDGPWQNYLKPPYLEKNYIDYLNILVTANNAPWVKQLPSRLLDELWTWSIKLLFSHSHFSKHSELQLYENWIFPQSQFKVTKMLSTLVSLGINPDILLPEKEEVFTSALTQAFQNKSLGWILLLLEIGAGTEQKIPADDWIEFLFLPTHSQACKSLIASYLQKWQHRHPKVAWCLLKKKLFEPYSNCNLSKAEKFFLLGQIEHQTYLIQKSALKSLFGLEFTDSFIISRHPYLERLNNLSEKITRKIPYLNTIKEQSPQPKAPKLEDTDVHARLDINFFSQQKLLEQKEKPHHVFNAWMLLHEYTTSIKNLLQDILKQIHEFIAPSPCEFAILGLGALSQNELWFQTKIEMVVLIENKSPNYLPHFKCLIKLFEFIINSLDFSIKDKIYLYTPTELLNLYHPRKLQLATFDNTNFFTMHRPTLLYASSKGNILYEDYFKSIMDAWTESTDRVNNNPIYPLHEKVAGLYLQKEFIHWNQTKNKKAKHPNIHIQEDYITPLVNLCHYGGLYYGLYCENTFTLLEKLQCFLPYDFIKSVASTLELLYQLYISKNNDFANQNMLTQLELAEELKEGFLQAGIALFQGQTATAQGNTFRYWLEVWCWQRYLYQELTEKLHEPPLVPSTEKSAIIQWAQLYWSLNEKKEFELNYDLINRYLKKEVQCQFLDENGNVIKQFKETEGRRYVAALKNQQGLIVAYIKEFPELPGAQITVDLLSSGISGKAHITTLSKITHPKSSFAKPFLLSPAQGPTLKTTLQANLDLRNVDYLLDPEFFTLKVAENLLLNPEDETLSNLVLQAEHDLEGKRRYFILSIDSDHAFVPIFSEQGKKYKLNMKTLVFFFTRMSLALDKNAINRIGAIEPGKFLIYLLEMLNKINEAWCGNANTQSPGLFKKTELAAYVKESHQFCFIPIIFPPGTIAEVYQKFHRIKTIIQQTDSTLPNISNHFVWLRIMEPRLSSCYEEAFKHKRGIDPISKFNHLPEEYDIKPISISIPEKSLTIMREFLQPSLTIINKKQRQDLKTAILNKNYYDLVRSLQELRDAIEQHDKLDSICQLFHKGNLEEFLSTLPQYEDSYFYEQLMKKIDWKLVAQNPSANQKSLEALFTQLNKLSYKQLNFVNCSFLNDSLLRLFLIASSNLYYLDLSGCVQLTEKSVTEISKHCLYVERIFISKWLALREIYQSTTDLFSSSKQFSHLRLLKLSDCSKLISIRMESPLLKKLYIIACPKLTRIEIIQTKMRVLQLEDCSSLKMVELGPLSLIQLTLLNCAQLSTSLIEKWLYTALQFTQLFLQGCPQLPFRVQAYYLARDNLWSFYNVDKFLNEYLLKNETLDLSDLPFTEESFKKLWHLLMNAQRDFNSFKLKLNLSFSTIPLKTIIHTLFSTNLFARCGLTPRQNKIEFPSFEFDLFEHKETIYALAVFPNEYLLASGSEDKTIKLWNIRLRYCIATLKGHEKAVTAIAVLNEQSFISASADTTIKLWQLKDFQCKHTFKGHTHSVNSLTIISSELIASGSTDHEIRIWNIPKKQCMQTIEGHNNEITSILYFPLLNHLVSGGSDKMIKIWNLDPYKCIHHFEEPVITFTKLDDYRFVSISRSSPFQSVIKLWNVQTLQTEFTHKIQAAIDTLYPCENYLALGLREGNILFLSKTTGEKLSELKTSPSSITSMTSLPDNRLVVAFENGNMSIWASALSSLHFTSEDNKTNFVEVSIDSNELKNVYPYNENQSDKPIIIKVQPQHESSSNISNSDSSLEKREFEIESLNFFQKQPKIDSHKPTSTLLVQQESSSLTPKQNISETEEKSFLKFT